MERQQSSTGVGLDAHVNVSLKFGELTNTLDMLADALKEADDKAKVMISEAVCKLRESGAQNLKAAAQAEEGHGEVTQLYNRTISRLQKAADKGDTEASQLLSEINP